MLGTDLDDELVSGVSLQGGFAAPGNLYHPGSDVDGQLVFLDADGLVQRELSTGLQDWDELNRAFVRGDSITWVGAHWLSGRSYDGLILGTDTAGGVGWALEIGGTDADMLVSVHGDYLVGYTRSWGQGEDDGLVLRMSADSVIWALVFGGTGFDGGKDIFQGDDGALIVGYTESYGNRGQAMILKVDSFGDLVWSRVFGGPDYDRLTMIAPLGDSTYMAAGTAGEGGVLLVEFTSRGDINWVGVAKATGYEVPLCLAVVDSAVYVGGKHSIGGPAFLLKIRNRALEWGEYLGSTAGDGLQALIPTDTCLLGLGYTSSFGFGRRDFMVLSLSPEGYNCTANPESFSLEDRSFVPDTNPPTASLVSPDTSHISPSPVSFLPPDTLWCEGVSCSEGKNPASGWLVRGVYDVSGRRLSEGPAPLKGLGPGVYFVIGPQRKKILVIK